MTPMEKFLEDKEDITVAFSPLRDWMTYDEWREHGAKYNIYAQAYEPPEYLEYGKTHGFRYVSHALSRDYGMLLRAYGECLSDDKFWEGRKANTRSLMSCARTRAMKQALMDAMPFILVNGKRRIPVIVAEEFVEVEPPKVGVRAFNTEI